MAVAVLSDSPTLTTGFGVTTRRIAAALARRGHAVSCFGLKAAPSDVPDTFDYHVWPAEQGGHWTETLGAFLAATKPTVVMLNMDAYNAVECLEACRAAGWTGPILSYVVFDGLPVSRHFLDAQRSCDAVLASSHTAAEYLKDNGVSVTGIAPPGVDGQVFRPHPDRTALRAQAALSDTTLVGVFGTNTERKQIARVLTALPAVQSQLPDSRLALYLHCQPVGYWWLAELADDLGIADRVIFPASGVIDERRGVPTTSIDQPLAVPDGMAGMPALPPRMSYVDRLNCCDVVVNVPHSGDIEQVILEAQACGIPLVHTDDLAVMSEAIGSGGVKLAARDIGIGRAGQRLHHVAPDDIATAITTVARDGGLRGDLRRSGLENAARYTWTALERGACAMAEPYF